MNILFVVPYVPNLIRVRPYNLIRYLSAKGNQITVLTLVTNHSDQVFVSRLSEVCHRVQAFHMPKWRSLFNSVQALPGRIPLQAVYSWQPSLAKKINELIYPAKGESEFDVMHVEHLRGARYGLLKPHASSRLSTFPIVWDSVDSISLLFRQAAVQSKNFFSRWLTRFELSRTEPYEGWLVSQFDRVLVTSENDFRSFISLQPPGTEPAAISILPNGVDLDYFQTDRRVVRDPATLVVSGKMSYHANVTMVLHLVSDIMPLIWSRRPDVKLFIVGKDPPRELMALVKHENILVTGTVEDIRPYLHKATLAVAPVTYGAGIQNKVLEAMACSTPVVATPQAVSALKVCPGEDLVTAAKDEEIADAILHLLQDDQHRMRLGETGRRYVEQYHNWHNVAAQLEQIYHGVIEEFRASSAVR